MNAREDALGRLQINWPQKFPPSRISFMERETREFDLDTLDKGVTHVLRTCEWPPTVKAIVDACRKFQSHKIKENVKPKPGDVIDGQTTFTPAEAQEELERLHKERPDLFGARPQYPKMATPDERKQTLEDSVTRLYISGLRKCASLDPQAGVSTVAVQFDLL